MKSYEIQFEDKGVYGTLESYDAVDTVEAIRLYLEKTEGLGCYSTLRYRAGDGETAVPLADSAGVNPPAFLAFVFRPRVVKIVDDPWDPWEGLPEIEVGHGPDETQFVRLGHGPHTRALVSDKDGKVLAQMERRTDVRGEVCTGPGHKRWVAKPEAPDWCHWLQARGWH